MHPIKPAESKQRNFLIGTIMKLHLHVESEKILSNENFGLIIKYSITLWKAKRSHFSDMVTKSKDTKQYGNIFAK